MFRNKFKRKLVTPFLLSAFGAIAAFSISYYRGLNNTSYPDAQEMIAQANGIAQGWHFLLSNPLLSKYPMGLPSLLAITFKITGSSSLILIKFIFAICHGFSVYLVARIGIQMGLQRKLWILAATCFAVDPFILSAATDLQVECLVTLVVLWWAFIFITSAEDSRFRLILLISFSITGFIAVTIRPNIIIPFLLVYGMLLYSWQREGLKKYHLGISVSCFVTLIIFFEIFLDKLYKGFVFLAPNGGLNAVLSCRKEFIPQYLGLASPSENSRINQWYFGYLQDLTQSIHSKQPKLSIPALNHEYIAVAISSCVHRPLESIEVLALKSAALWRPFTVLGASGAKVWLISLLLWTPLTIATIWFVSKGRIYGVNAKLKSYFLLISIGFTISLIVGATQIRHRIPFAEPFYWLFFFFFISEVLTKIEPFLSRWNMKLKRK